MLPSINADVVDGVSGGVGSGGDNGDGDSGGLLPRPLQPVRHLLLWLCSAFADPLVLPAADAVAAQRALARAYRSYVDAFDPTAPVPPPVAPAGGGGGVDADDIFSAAVESPLGRLRPWTGAATAARVTQVLLHGVAV